MFSHFSRRIAGLGAVAVVALGGALVGGVAPAQAASVDTSYTCETVNGPATSATKVKLSLPASAKAGSTVKARPFKMTIALPSELVDTLRFFGITALSGDATDLRYTVGKTAVAVKNGKIRETPVPASGTMKLVLKGKSAAFKAPAAGKHVVKVPAKYTLNLKNQKGEALGGPMPCTRDKGAKSKLGTLTTTKSRQGALGLRP